MLEALYREVTLKRALQVSFEDMMREIQGLVDQMDEEERERYLVESLFLNTVTYENEMLDAYMRKLTGGTQEGARAGRRGGRREDVARPLRSWSLAAALAGLARAAARRRRPAPAAAPAHRRGAGRPSTSARRCRRRRSSKEFAIRNFGDADLVIENVSTTCGCTVAELATQQGREARRQHAAAGEAADARPLGPAGAGVLVKLERSRGPTARAQGRGARSQRPSRRRR